MRVKIEPIAEDELCRMYLDDEMTLAEIGELVGVSDVTILRWMKLYGISRRTNSESHLGQNIKIPIPEDELRRMYLDEHMTSMEIAKLVGVSYVTIYRWMKLYDMPKRTLSESKLGRNIRIPIPEDEIRRMYLDKKMTMIKIAELVGVSDTTIQNWMKKYNMPRRTLSEAQILIDNNGPNNPKWTGGPKKYCYKFSQRFREAVRNRDDYTCQYCGVSQQSNGKKLSVHHIHYDAENCYPDVISLCTSCHSFSNGCRDEWEEICMILLANRGLLDWEPPWSEERDQNDT